MGIDSFIKQPVDVVDYDIDYSEWLTEGDNVQNVNVAVSPEGLNIDSVFLNDPRVKIWVSGGTDGTVYKISTTMTSADGRIKQFEFKIRVKDI